MRMPRLKDPFAAEIREAEILTSKFRNLSKRLGVVVEAMHRSARTINKDFMGLNKKLNRFYDDGRDVPMDLYTESNKARKTFSKLKSLESLLLSLNT